MDYEKLMAQARETNTKRDRDERRSGLTPLSDSGPWELLLTAITAIKAGIVKDDWNAVAEAQGMLETIVAKYQPVRVPSGIAMNPREKEARRN